MGLTSSCCEHHLTGRVVLVHQVHVVLVQHLQMTSKTGEGVSLRGTYGERSGMRNDVRSSRRTGSDELQARMVPGKG